VLPSLQTALGSVQEPRTWPELGTCGVGSGVGTGLELGDGLADGLGVGRFWASCGAGADVGAGTTGKICFTVSRIV
jgi:hypothetical protein